VSCTVVHKCSLGRVRRQLKASRDNTQENGWRQTVVAVIYRAVPTTLQVTKR
jgi:hypothetical protein